MPEEVVIVVIFSLIAFTTVSVFITRSIFSYLRDRSNMKNQKSDQSSLTTSELERMLSRVVKEANAPLLARIEDLEEQLIKRGATLALPEAKPNIDEELFDQGPGDLAAVSKADKSEE